MPITIKMPALSPTMEEGTLARWLVKEGDSVAAGDIMAEIETDKATMEFEAVDEGTIASILIAEGTEGVKVGTAIALLAEEGEDAAAIAASGAGGGSDPASTDGGDGAGASGDLREVREEKVEGERARAAEQPAAGATAAAPQAVATRSAAQDAPGADRAGSADGGRRVVASPLARRLAEQKGLDLAAIAGSGPNGRIVKADVDQAQEQPARAAASAAKPDERTASQPQSAGATAQAGHAAADGGTPFEAEKLSNIRKVIARRLTESKREVPHYYLTVDIHLDPLLALRQQLNASLEADGVKLSVNDLLIKALARALMRVPQCNVSFQGDTLHRYSRADIAVAVAAPSGLITPIVTEADTRGLAAISTGMKELIDKARDGKLQPHEYQGGSASLSNLGMYGIKQFDAVINPPQGMIMAVGAGERRPWVLDGELTVATVMSASGSFDHRAIDGADGAQLMAAFKQLCEQPMGLVV